MQKPSNNFDPVAEIQQLALVYVQKQNLNGKTPEEVLDMYSSTLNRMHAHLTYLGNLK